MHPDAPEPFTAELCPCPVLTAKLQRSSLPDPLRLFKIEGSEGIDRGRSGREMREREEGKGSK